MADPGVLKNSIREHGETLNSGQSIKRNHVIKEEAASPQGQRATRCPCERLPPVPKRSDPAPALYPPSHSNYVDYNVKHVADMANFRESKLQIVDSKDGHVMDLEKSGLVPIYKDKPNYGRMPTYLKKGSGTNNQTIREVVEKAKAESIDVTAVVPKIQRDATRPPVSKEIEVLQKRWIELEKRLRLISFSRPDKREAIEDELRSIEVRLRMAISHNPQF